MENNIVVKKEVNKTKILNIVKNIIVYSLLTFWGLIVLFPFYWMVLSSFKHFSDYIAESIPILYLNNPTLDNYAAAWSMVNLFGYVINTTIYAVITTLIMIVVASLASFAFARLDFRGKEIVFTIFLAMMMIPNELVIITNYNTIVNANLRNTYVGLILPSVLSVFYIYLLRQNFMQVPDSIYYAARVDGTTDLGYLCKVLIPLSKPTIISILILKLIECWNAFIWPRLVSTSDDYYLISNAIQTIKSSGFGRDNIPAMMAAVVSVTLPLLIIFVIFRKQIMAGVAKTGTKG